LVLAALVQLVILPLRRFLEMLVELKILLRLEAVEAKILGLAPQYKLPLTVEVEAVVEELQSLVKETMAPETVEVALERQALLAQAETEAQAVSQELP
jgi:hypothetical protein